MTIIKQKKRLVIILSTAMLLLLIPFIAMQFSSNVNWTLSDFIVAGILLTGTGFAFELVLRKITNIKYRIAICAAIFVVLILIWLELAVGIFGSPFAGN